MKDFNQMKPREVEAYFRDLILREFGDKVENQANINSHSGSYYISFEFEGVDYMFRFKKKNAAKVAKQIRALKA